ncbi:hypothetical protein [Methylobacterium sp. JK268]
MGAAARDHDADERSPGSALLQRLLLRPPARPLDAHFAVAAVADDEDDLEEIVSFLEAENLVIKAALKSERAETAELRARLEAADESETLQDIRADRDRWANLVERLLFAPR